MTQAGAEQGLLSWGGRKQEKISTNLQEFEGNVPIFFWDIFYKNNSKLTIILNFFYLK